MYVHAEKSRNNTSRAAASRVSKTQNGGQLTSPLVDNRPAAVQMKKLQEMMGSHAAAHQADHPVSNNTVTQRAWTDATPVQLRGRRRGRRRRGGGGGGGGGGAAPVAAPPPPPPPPPRTVTNRMAQNMQQSLARVFGGHPTRYQIDQHSGSTFSDGRPHYTTGHHRVRVTDTHTRQDYRCDFHRDGAYYTRTHPQLHN